MWNSHSGDVGEEKQASPETDHPKAEGWISPHNCCFLPLTKDNELKFQHRQNPWDLGGCTKGCPAFAQPTSVKWCHPQKHLWRTRVSEIWVTAWSHGCWITVSKEATSDEKGGHDSTTGVSTGLSWTGSFTEGLIICHCVLKGEVLIQKIFKHQCNFRHVIQLCNTSLHQVQLVPVSSTGSGQAHKWPWSVVPCGRPPWMEMQLSVLCLICQQGTSLFPAACSLSGTPATSHQAWGKLRKTKSYNCGWWNILFWGDDTGT